MAKRRGGRKIGRSARTGRFITVLQARRRKGTHVVETIRRGRKRK
jgi:hypothetical protein